MFLAGYIADNMDQIRLLPWEFIFFAFMKKMKTEVDLKIYSRRKKLTKILAFNDYKD